MAATYQQKRIYEKVVAKIAQLQSNVEQCERATKSVQAELDEYLDTAEKLRVAFEIEEKKPPAKKSS